jgi:putative membrane protein
MSTDTFGPRVIEVEERVETPVSAAPQVVMSDKEERVVPTERALTPPALPAPPVRDSSRVVSFGLAGLGVFLAGWFMVDAYWWVSAAFERSLTLGGIATTAVLAGAAGAGAIIYREVKSLWQLRSVEEVRERMADEVIRPTDARKIISEILAEVPKERDVVNAISVFQRQSQPHHSVAQQVEILSRTVMKPLDQRAEAHIRTAVVRAFGITAISPTPLTDALFFIACGVRMVRGIASSYGHRPTAAATTHLLRRLLIEAGKLGVIDIASNTLAQHIGGAIAERVASTAADSLYASYRMARLGVIVMDLCRPVAFQKDDVPSISSLVGNVITRRSESAS